ncbi:trigger factor [bacterium]|nr:trigger factor [bacterium]NIN93089.1 trigger factor [bacterium]NIO18945.1 trigger factor [bacterium]NIO74027.1 trigger factor [bacterium]
MENLKAEMSKKNECELVFKIEIPQAEVEKEIELAYNKIQKEAVLPGFRKGKAPPTFLREKFKSRCQEAVLESLLPGALSQVLREKGIDPIAPAKISDLKFDFDKPGPISFQAMVEVIPHFEPRDYKKLKIRKETKVVGDSEVGESLKELQKRNAQLVVSRNEVVDKKSYVVIDYQGFGNGKPVKDLRGENQLISVENPIFLPEFSEGLIGMERDREKDIEVNFPDNYFNKELAGKKILFKAKVKEIKERRLPEIDDTFAQELGAKSLKELKDKLRENLIKLEEHRADEAMREQVVDRLIENNPVAVPNSLVERQLDYLMSKMKGYLQSRGLSSEDIGADEEVLRKKYRNLAEKQVRSALIFTKIAEKENIKVDSKEIEKEIEETVKSTKEKEEEIKRYFYENIDQITSRMRENKVFDFLIENAKIIKEKRK